MKATDFLSGVSRQQRTVDCHPLCAADDFHVTEEPRKFFVFTNGSGDISWFDRHALSFRRGLSCELQKRDVRESRKHMKKRGVYTYFEDLGRQVLQNTSQVKR